MHQVNENLLDKNDLPHTVAECICTSRLQSILKEYGLSHTVRNGMYVANTKVY